MLARMILMCCAIGLLWGQSFPADASGWQRAESEHYVVHADMSSEDLRQLMQEMEDFNQILRQILPLEIEPGRKLELYLTPNSERISRVASLGVSGLSVTAPDAMLAFARFDLTDPIGMKHEAPFFYAARAHLAQAVQKPVPPWLRGVSSFLATAYPLRQGHYALGAPHPARPPGAPASIAELQRTLTYQSEPKQQDRFERFAEVSQQIASVVLLDPRYSGVIHRHITAYTSGASMDEAASEFGDLTVLQKLIIKSFRTIRPSVRVIALPPSPPAEITLRPMSKAQIALIDARFKRFHARHRAANSRQLRELTDRFADSALVWYEYAANEFARVQTSEFGDDPLFRGFGFANGELLVMANRHSDAEAWRAVNRALALDPGLAEAQCLRAEILLNRLVRAGDIDDLEAFAEVRRLLAPLARSSAAHPLAAALYYQSYIEQDQPAPDIAFDQLATAFRTNAGVLDLRYAYAVALSRRGQADEARSLLTSLLNSPQFAETAERALNIAP